MQERHLGLGSGKYTCIVALQFVGDVSETGFRAEPIDPPPGNCLNIWGIRVLFLIG